MAKSIEQQIDALRGKFGDLRYVLSDKTLYLSSGTDIAGYIAALREITPDLKVFAIKANSDVSDEEIKILSQLSEVTDLYLPNSLLTENGFAELKKFSSLTILGLYGSKNFSAESARHLLEMKASLVSLDIGGSNLDDAGLEVITGLNLERLSLPRTKVTEEGLVKALPKLKNLEKLTLNGLKISEKTGVVVYALAKLGNLESVPTNLGGAEFGKWQPFISHQLHLNQLNKANQLTLTPEMQAQLDEARELLKAPSPNTGKGDAKSVVEQGKGKGE